MLEQEMQAMRRDQKAQAAKADKNQKLLLDKIDGLVTLGHYRFTGTRNRISGIE